MTDFDSLYQEHEKLRLLLKIIIQNSSNPELRDRYVSKLRILFKQCISGNTAFNDGNSKTDHPTDTKMSAPRSQSKKLVKLLRTLQNQRLPQSEWLANLAAFQEQLPEYLEAKEMAFLQLRLPGIHTSHPQSHADLQRIELAE